MDMIIAALIAAGEESIRQEEEERAYEERQEQERIKALWDQFDAILRPALPEVLRQYMVPLCIGHENEPDIDLYKAFHVEIAIPDLAPFRIKLVLEDEQWQPVWVFLPVQSWSEYDCEPFLSFKRASEWEQLPIEDLHKALFSAKELGNWLKAEKDRFEKNEQARQDPQYVPVDTEEDCLRVIKEQIRSIVRQELEAEHVGS